MGQEKVKYSFHGARERALFKGAIGSAFVGTTVAVFLTLYLKKYINYTPLEIWCYVVTFFGAIRIGITLGFKKKKELFPIKTWGRLYVIFTYLYSAVWASSSFVLLNVIPHERDPFFVTLLLGMASGGAISHIASKRLAQFYCMSIVFCHSLKTLIEARPDCLYIVAAELLYVILLYKMVKVFNGLYDKSQNLAVELQDKLDLEKEFQKQKVQALQKSKLASLGEMAAGMAHEINNPLTISMGKLDVLNRLIQKTKGLPDTFYTQIGPIMDANKRAAAIVNSIRNLSRMKEESEFQNFDVNELVDLVKPLISIKLGANNIKLIEDFENFTLYADKGEISQVLLNVLNNGIDAVKDMDGDKWIRITTEKDANQVTIRVIDSGLVEQLDDIDKIFEPFFTTKDIGEGTGLGLSLSKSIMARNSGAITVDLSGENTCFKISLKSAA